MIQFTYENTLKIMTEILKYSKKHLLRMPSVVFEVLTVEYAPI